MVFGFRTTAIDDPKLIQLFDVGILAVIQQVDVNAVAGI